ncbi:MAG: glutathione S-transferase N-terminal domain-containing protein [Gallionella sp.]|nr:glutathione S-transferase N-terminal domain-containing protein [Gallionella sp.]
MKLLGTNTSPYVRKVRLVLLEKQIPHEYIVDAPRDPGSLSARVNPLARVPALILDDDFCVFDSPVITDYVDTLNDTPILIPHDPFARLRVKRWEALADGIMDAAVIVQVERLRATEHQHPGVFKVHNRTISHALEYAAQALGENSWFEGAAISLADLSLVSALLYLDLRQPERDWRTAHPNLAIWFERVHARPSVQATLI